MTIPAHSTKHQNLKPVTSQRKTNNCYNTGTAIPKKESLYGKCACGCGESINSSMHVVGHPFTKPGEAALWCATTTCVKKVRNKLVPERLQVNLFAPSV